ncbi:LON peptidase N-terminal domain and RING finger protein 1 isoform X2 [Engraulis encrasicolus]|uniref:LON peptidase N-terminal domain and RING finger protein 1 isoform X2 n=1 Tax=Engraulis encrasicolus TaxID=184585 RepID=UPI002FD229A4
MDLMECPICLFLMCEPVTMGCGHSFCRRCLGSYLPSRCPACKEKFRQRDAKHNKNNVLLISVIEKCCPEETKMKCHIQEKLKASEFTEALRMADEGIELAPDDVSLKVWHAEANLGLRRFSDALRDLDELCGARPSWTEGFFRKGNALLEMGRQTEALLQFHHCLRQQADFAPAKASIKKILEAEGMSVPDEVPEILQLVSDFLQQPCPITSSVDSQQGDRKRRASEDGDRGRGDLTRAAASAKLDSSTECCLSLCQAVSFLPTAEDDEEPMMTKEERHSRASCSVDRQSSLGVLTVSDFECPLCIRLFYEPVTTPCGHTFCKNCIERSLDHNLRCPLCKQPLQEYLKNRKYNPTVLLQDIMSRLFPSQLAERKQVHDTEMAELSNLTTSVPIFVCTVAYPGIPCPLHVFEPRYRLMMRRCMETGTKKFGMCCYEPGKGFADYGTMLEILEMDMLPDGRSFVDTIGGGRFHVLRRGQRDGYHTADVEYLEDGKVEGAELEVLQRLHDGVYQQASDWYQQLGSHIQEQISRRFGAMPQKDENIQASVNGPMWCWWLLSVLQLDPTYQTTVLSLTSLKDRLGHLRLMLEYFSHS